MTTGAELAALQDLVGPEYSWEEAVPLPGGEDRLVAIAKRISLPA
jgi:hypothetical protein